MVSCAAHHYWTFWWHARYCAIIGYMTDITISPVSIKPIEPSKEEMQFLLHAVNEYAAAYGTAGLQEVMDYVFTILSGQVPESVPGLLVYDSGAMSVLGIRIHTFLTQEAGYYARVTRQFAETLSEAIGPNARVLDPMAGRGLLVRALQEQGVEVLGTDNNSWGLSDSIEVMDVLKSIRAHGDWATHLVLAWPPYNDSVDVKILQEVRTNFPHLKVVYIGEVDGCTGSERFWEVAQVSEFDYPVMYETFGCAHDYVYLVK